MAKRIDASDLELVIDVMPAPFLTEQPVGQMLTAIPTPENTPVPGGGSWKWDDALPGWVENAPYAPPLAASFAATPQPILE